MSRGLKCACVLLPFVKRKASSRWSLAPGRMGDCGADLNLIHGLSERSPSTLGHSRVRKTSFEPQAVLLHSIAQHYFVGLVMFCYTLLWQ